MTMYPDYKQALLAVMVIFGVMDLVAAQSAIPCKYEVTHIIQGPFCGNFGYPPTTGTGISPDGRYVVGYYQVCTIGSNRGFWYDTQTTQFSILPHPPNTYASYPAAVSESGIIVGSLWRNDVGQRGFVYSIGNAAMVELPPYPDGDWSGATGINARGTVCGWRSIGPGLYPQTAFIWTERGGFFDLGPIDGVSTSAAAINDRGAICGRVGNANNSANARGLVYIDGVATVLPPVPGGFTSTCTAVNNLNQACGYGRYPGRNGDLQRAFLWTMGRMTSIGILPGFFQSTAVALNDRSDIVGVCNTTADAYDAVAPCVWHNRIPRDLNSLVPEQSGVFIGVPLAINPAGQITGWGINQDADSVGFVLTPILPPFAEVTGDCYVNVNDLLLVINEWGKTTSPADINSDGVVDLMDLYLVIDNWSP